MLRLDKKQAELDKNIAILDKKVAMAQAVQAASAPYERWICFYRR